MYTIVTIHTYMHYTKARKVTSNCYIQGLFLENNEVHLRYELTNRVIDDLFGSSVKKSFKIDPCSRR